MRHVIWIGGPPGSGKTTVARQLARRHGLRLYSSDTQTWVHRDRAVRAEVASAQRWESLGPADRWEQEPEALLAMSLHIERGAMVIEDLGFLPDYPLIVAEGSVLPASAVSSGIAERSRAVWLMPAPEFFEAQLAARETGPGPATLYRLLRQTIEREVKDHDVPTLTVDGSRGVVETVLAVEELFHGALSAGPRAETTEERKRLLWEMNEAIVSQVRGYYSRPWAEGDPSLARGRFVCECGDPLCEAEVSLAVGAVEAGGPVIAAGHD